VSAIVTQAANLNIRYWLTFDGQRFTQWTQSHTQSQQAAHQWK